MPRKGQPDSNKSNELGIGGGRGAGRRSEMRGPTPVPKNRQTGPNVEGGGIHATPQTPSHPAGHSTTSNAATSNAPKYKTVGIIDRPGRYRKSHPDEKLRSWKDPSGHWRAVRSPKGKSLRDIQAG
jgi:hypothetical protein